MKTTITITDVVEHVFCPKFTYFEKVLGIPQNEKRRGTVLKGRQIHETKATTNKKYQPSEYAGGKTIIEQQFYSQEHAFTGKIDRAILKQDCAIIFETKYSTPFIRPTVLTQLALQAILLEENFRLPCTLGIVEFVREPKKTVEVNIDQKIKTLALQNLDELRAVINEGIMPPSVLSRIKFLSVF